MSSSDPSPAAPIPGRVEHRARTLTAIGAAFAGRGTAAAEIASRRTGSEKLETPIPGVIEQ